MEKIERFEDLKCWQAARTLANLVYQLTSEGQLATDFDLRSQIRRAAIGAMNNIAEGFGRSSTKEYTRFLEISQSSSMEVKSLSYLIEDQSLLNQAQVAELRESAEKTKSITLGLIRYLKTRRRGPSSKN